MGDIRIQTTTYFTAVTTKQHVVHLVELLLSLTAVSPRAEGILAYIHHTELTSCLIAMFYMVSDKF